MDVLQGCHNSLEDMNQISTFGEGTRRTHALLMSLVLELGPIIVAMEGS